MLFRSWGATATETALGILLLIGWRPRLVGAASCLVLLVFAVSMAVSLGMESPLSYSVFSAASGAAAYAILGAASPSPTAEATPVAPNVPGSAKKVRSRLTARIVRRGDLLQR